MNVLIIGNGGTAEIAKNVPIQTDDAAALVAFAQKNHIDLTIIGPDDPLAAGVVDQFQAAGLRVFGPTAAAARIDSSKAFSKQLMSRQHIPTARYGVFTNPAKALQYLKGQPLPLVV